METRFRLLPLAIAAAIALLGIKLGDLWSVLAAAPVAMAQAPPAAAAKSVAAGPASAPPAAKADQPAAAAAAAAPAPSDKPRAIDPLSLSAAEVDLLQKLSQRRAELDKRAAELSQREVLLEATEKRIDEKIAQLASLERDIGGIVQKQSEAEEARMRSLVKIYETMKPHDAARIFEQLDMPVLLGVVEHMKERSAAPILASMEPAKARAVTLAIAERRDARAKAEAAQKPPAKP